MKWTRTVIYSFAIFLGLFLVQGTFFFLQNTQANTGTAAIQALLRQETSVNNPFLMSRTISDLRESKIIKCAKLTESATRLVHFDIRYKDKCGESFLQLNGRNVQVFLRGLNGDLWTVEFQSVNDSFFETSLWLSRLLLSLVIFFSTWFYFKRSDQLNSESEKLKTVKQKNEKLLDLTAQAAHDVASPLTMMNIVIETQELSPFVKENLVLVKERFHGIVGGLKKQGVTIENETPHRPCEVDIVKILDSVIKEKSILHANIGFTARLESLIVKADAVELERVISNILNNAIEATKDGSEVSISLVSDTKKSLIISDRGIGISEKNLVKLGSKGMTFGKPHGSGLGLFHAKNCMNNWNGSLEIESQVGKGTTVKLIFPS